MPPSALSIENCVVALCGARGVFFSCGPPLQQSIFK